MQRLDELFPSAIAESHYSLWTRFSDGVEISPERAQAKLTFAGRQNPKDIETIRKPEGPSSPRIPSFPAQPCKRVRQTKRHEKLFSLQSLGLEGQGKAFGGGLSVFWTLSLWSIL